MGKLQVGLITLAVSLLLGTVTLLNDPTQASQSHSWLQWKQEFAQEFGQEIDIYRQLVFRENERKVIEHNSQLHKGYEMGINGLAHLSSLEFQGMFANKAKLVQQIEIMASPPARDINPSNDMDWEKQGKITAVKNQGQCDAGYAFCTNGLLESFNLISTRTATDLSEQQIIDCAANYTTFGCQSGSRSGTIQFLQDVGVTTTAKYPYTGVKQACKNTGSDFKLTKSIVIANGCTELKNQLNVSPLTVAVNTNNWQLYKSGIFENCGSEVDHDILLIGYAENYWRLKNSWGVRWGEYGYIRLRMGDTCGICSKPGFGFKV